ncbi:MAG: hypothetical protein QG657_907 [Acidobacteriota bacterium]|nr:hypothetical protein [Acidobacteriota bacterium]
MTQLYKRSNQHNILWSSGCSIYLVSSRVGRWRFPIAVKCRLGNLDATELALLDSGAEWSVMGGETAKILEDDLLLPTKSFIMSTRLGRISGSLYRINISLLAEENSGYDLTVESSIFVSNEWKGPIILGYRGFLERIRFALDPGVVPGEQRFYFGLAG